MDDSRTRNETQSRWKRSCARDVAAIRETRINEQSKKLSRWTVLNSDVGTLSFYRRRFIGNPDSFAFSLAITSTQHGSFAIWPLLTIKTTYDTTDHLGHLFSDILQTSSC